MTDKMVEFYGDHSKERRVLSFILQEGNLDSIKGHDHLQFCGPTTQASSWPTVDLNVPKMQMPRLQPCR